MLLTTGTSVMATGGFGAPCINNCILLLYYMYVCFSGHTTDFWREICLGTVVQFIILAVSLFCLEFFSMDDQQFCILILALIQLLVFRRRQLMFRRHIRLLMMRICSNTVLDVGVFPLEQDFVYKCAASAKTSVGH